LNDELLIKYKQYDILEVYRFIENIKEIALNNELRIDYTTFDLKKLALEEVILLENSKIVFFYYLF